MFLQMLPVAGCTPGAGRCGRSGVRQWAGKVPGTRQEPPTRRGSGGCGGEVCHEAGEPVQDEYTVLRGKVTRTCRGQKGWGTADTSVVFMSAGGEVNLSTRRDAEERELKEGVALGPGVRHFHCDRRERPSAELDREPGQSPKSAHSIDKPLRHPWACEPGSTSEAHGDVSTVRWAPGLTRQPGAWRGRDGHFTLTRKSIRRSSRK